MMAEERTMRRFLSRTAASLVAGILLASCTGGTSSAPPTDTAPSVSATVTPGSIEVPDVVGLDPSAAKKQIESLGLSLIVTTMKGDYTDAAVIEQDPPPGTVVEYATLVNIVIGPA
jgi:hypothetical protein